MNNKCKKMKNAQQKTKIFSIIKYFALFLLLICSLRSSCQNQNEPPVTPSEGNWSVSSELGIMSGPYRINIDKYSRLHTQGQIPEAIIELEFNPNKVPSNRIVYWVLSDPDDPASNSIIDPNGNSGNDNILRGKLDSAYHGSIRINDTIFQTRVDTVRRKTSVKIRVFPDEQNPEPEDFCTGDNFLVKAFAGSLSGPNITSLEITTWKTMGIEVDYADFGSSFSLDASFFDKIRPYITGCVTGAWNSNECLYLDTRQLVLWFDQRNLPRSLPHLPGVWLDTAISSFPHALTIMIGRHSAQFINYPVHMMFFGGVKDWRSSWEPCGMGYGAQDPVSPQYSYSIVFIDTVIAEGRRGGLSNDSIVDLAAYVSCHELGHQFAGIKRHCSNYNCVMKEAPVIFYGSRVEKQPFCPVHVDSVRKKGTVIHFK